uniref:Uncharacterized protein n=1 Tax=Plectus sambesii TaxID=2011161 RepID=A0A914VDZ8_9BILA
MGREEDVKILAITAWLTLTAGKTGIQFLGVQKRKWLTIFEVSIGQHECRFERAGRIGDNLPGVHGGPTERTAWSGWSRRATDGGRKRRRRLTIRLGRKESPAEGRFDLVAARSRADVMASNRLGGERPAPPIQTDIGFSDFSTLIYLYAELTTYRRPITPL